MACSPPSAKCASACAKNMCARDCSLSLPVRALHAEASVTCTSGGPHTMLACRLSKRMMELLRAQASLWSQAVPREHAFAQLSSSDNVISFTTERYHAQPLIIRCEAGRACLTSGSLGLQSVGVCIACARVAVTPYPWVCAAHL